MSIIILILEYKLYSTYSVSSILYILIQVMVILVIDCPGYAYTFVCGGVVKVHEMCNSYNQLAKYLGVCKQWNGLLNTGMEFFKTLISFLCPNKYNSSP